MIPAGFADFLPGRQTGANRSPRAVSAARIDDLRSGRAMGPPGLVNGRVPAGMFEKERQCAECPPSGRPRSTGRPRWRHGPKGPPRIGLCAKGSRTSADCPPGQPTPGECLGYRPESSHYPPMCDTCVTSLPTMACARHIARECRSIGRECDTNFGLGTARSYKRKCQNRPISHSAPPASRLATRPQGPQVQKVQKPSSRPFWTF